jgi:hypothetical protein
LKTGNLTYYLFQRKNTYLREDLIKVHHEHTYLCDGDCSQTKFITESQAVNQAGWFFFEDCVQRLFPGYFSKEELVIEIDFNNVWKHIKNQKKLTSWPNYLRKIKRSCRHHGTDYPDWIQLNYDTI